MGMGPELLGAEKFGSFVDECGGNQAQAAKLAVFNFRLAGAYLPALAAMELALRNRIASALAEEFGPDWPERLAAGDVVSSLRSRRKLNLLDEHADMFREARDHLRRKDRPAEAPDIIGATSMGIWVGLTGQGAPHRAKYYESQLWTPVIRKAFPALDAAYGGRVRGGRYTLRESLHHDLNRLLDFRNRVAHHERITHLDHEVIVERLARVMTALVEIIPVCLDDLIPIPDEWSKRRINVLQGGARC